MADFVDVGGSVLFSVDLAALRDVPEMLGRMADDAKRCRLYAEEYFDFAFGPGVLNRATGRHDEAREKVRDFFRRVEHLAAAQRDAVTAAIDYYEGVDLVAAARTDALLPPTRIDPVEGRSPRLRPDLLQARVREQNEPIDALTEPPDYSTQDPYQPQWSDLVSPGNVARDATWGVTWLGAKLGICDRAYDPLDDFVLPMTGNWAGMHACADALANLAEAARLLQGNADWIALRVEAVWLGNAADACWIKVRGLAKALDAAQHPLNDLSSAYAGMVDEMKFLEGAMELLVIDLIDAVFFATLAVATSETVVGAVVFGGAAVYEISRVVGHVNDVLSHIEKARNAVDVFGGKTDGFGLLNTDLPALPAAPAA